MLDTLRLIPRSRYASTEDIHRQLEALGYGVSRRTVERDLLALTAHYGIQCDDRSRPYGWRWGAGSHPPLTPTLDLQQALGLSLMERELGTSLPRTVREALSPWFAESRKRLIAQGGAKAARWGKKLAFESLGPPLLPPADSPGTLDVVNEALFTERPLLAEYRRAYGADYRAVRLHPLGLIRTGLVIYLVACFDGYGDPRMLAMHRMRRARIDKDGALEAPADFDLKAYLNSGALDFGNRGPVRLRLRMQRDAAAHLHDTPLSHDQTVTSEGDGEYVIVEATVNDSDRLEWWIRGFGDLVERLPDGITRVALRKGQPSTVKQPRGNV